ncbi:hypothetical protein SCT_0695 [Sulfuricella sp. T08]|uniref:hypothetical protein n=1 Tax=Sulfuricella sp. T08 TaxID=1632857 RepID=UPI0006179DE3|nr:hypothetical protein [Sulfuricella sp. T08]GAO35310.1 hypothetical protein SCT_0695 [Sulfuricella sp. T08]
MRIAVLFNADHPQYGVAYGWAIRDKILSTAIIQNSGRHVKVKIGDVLIYSHAKSKTDYEGIAEHTYFSHPWQLLLSTKLRETYLKSTVFAWVIQNIDETTARQLHAALLTDGGYLGMHGVDLTNAAHLVLYRNSLIGKYRIKGKSCRIFYSMGEEDGKDESEPDELKALGLTDVEWEDKGAHGTIFDDYDTPDHFSRVEVFRKMISKILPDGDDGADELVLILEDLSPRLFSTLGAVARALEMATHEEDFAQVGVSARRYIEQLSDVLFPPQKEMYKGMDVTRNEFKNRLLAYIDQAIPDQETGKAERWKQLRKELGLVIDETNAAVHGTPDKTRVSKAISDLASLSAVLLQLNPEMARNPYFAFNESITNFFKDVLHDSQLDDSSQVAPVSGSL